MSDKIIRLGYYIKPNRKNASKGAIYDANGICPCICDFSGGVILYLP